MTSRSHLASARDRLTDVRRVLLRRRRSLAVVLIAVAVLAGLRATAPPEPPTVPAWVAARDLPAGLALTSAHLRAVELPSATAPEGLLEDPVGAVLAGPMGAGEPVTAMRLVGPGLTAPDPGAVALPVRFSDAAQVELLGVGDRVDVLATDPQAGTTHTVVSSVTVLAIPDSGRPSSDSHLTGRLVVLGVPERSVTTITSATVATFVTFAWSRG
jgi:Flp pilus assembly protein CpaB